MRNRLTRHLAATALVMGVLVTVVPARAEAAVAAVRPADSLVQMTQYYGRPGYPGYYGRPRYYGRPHFYGRPSFYGRPRYYSAPRFYGPRRGYYARRGYYR